MVGIMYFCTKHEQIFNFYIEAVRPNFTSALSISFIRHFFYFKTLGTFQINAHGSMRKHSNRDVLSLKTLNVNLLTFF